MENMIPEPFLPTAYFNGKFVSFDMATVSVATHALQYGSGVFGGLRGYLDNEGHLRIFRILDHMQRFAQSASLLGISLPHSPTVLEQIIVDLVLQNKPKTDIYIRPFAYKAGLNLPPGMLGVEDGLAIYMAALGRLHTNPELGLKVKVSSWRRIDDTMIPARGKIAGAYVNSSLAKDEAVAHGFDEAILLNQDGSVSEASTSNVFIAKDGCVITPPVSDNILEGITRRSVIQLSKDLSIPLLERSLDRSELWLADEVFVSGTAVELNWVKQVDQHEVGSGKAGPVFTKIHTAFDAIIRDDAGKYTDWITKVQVS